MTAHKLFIPAVLLFTVVFGVSCNRELCDNTCVFANDGECDDGGEGAIKDSHCEYGTDCNDCGVRTKK